ncbi:helix-turn-helix domain-containing protein [Humibacter ginsengiterrae]
MNALPESAAREAIAALSDTLRSGRDVILAGADDTVTTSQAAKVLGISRAHLYKVLDSGALAYTIVGARDRRISMADLTDFVARTEELRRATARAVAQPGQTRALAIDEI